ncbi:Secreted esterase B [Corynebacterium glyciniphilum AJ 3170]|uniref:Secreted esterase B n=1 Tax=Corynebacterium glyciniphilum AJ 3170 TaxID=1404245 RepID=X5DJK6_9CORY|nr:Secreted esterase B [Corynebacterium glyciniphilum AJ 3170]
MGTRVVWLLLSVLTSRNGRVQQSNPQDLRDLPPVRRTSGPVPDPRPAESDDGGRSQSPVRRRIGRSLAVLTATVMVGALVWVGHSPAGENEAALEEYREQTVRENAVAASESIVPTAAEAELGNGPKLDGPAPGSSKKISLSSGDRTREGVLSVPEGYDPAKPYPVLLTYHGYRESAQGFHDYAGFDEKPAITVSMQGIGDSWEGAPYAKTKDGEDVRFTRDMLAALNTTYNIDRSRIYAAGMSNGGGMVAKLACREPRLFAAVASVAGAYYSGTRTNCVEDAGRAPSFLEIHGTKDETINYQGGSRHGGTYMAVRDLVEDVASRNHCQSTPVTTALAGDVRRQQWPMCSPGTSVVHLRVGDGGHTWPGDASGASGAASDSAEATSYSLDATTEVWSFLSGHQLT